MMRPTWSGEYVRRSPARISVFLIALSFGVRICIQLLPLKFSDKLPSGAVAAAGIWASAVVCGIGVIDVIYGAGCSRGVGAGCVAAVPGAGDFAVSGMLSNDIVLGVLLFRWERVVYQIGIANTPVMIMYMALRAVFLRMWCARGVCV